MDNSNNNSDETAYEPGCAKGLICIISLNERNPGQELFDASSKSSLGWHF